MRVSEARIIITTCYEYSELLETLIYSYNKHWPDREWPITIASDYLNNDQKLNPNFNVFTHQDIYWSNILINCLKNCKEDIVLLALDDFILQDKVNNQLLYSLVLNMKRNADINYLRLVPRPKPKNKSMAVFAELSKKEPYRLSLQASLWRKSFLVELLVSNESPWQFEINGNKRSEKYLGFYSSSLDLFPYKHHVIQRGKWFPWSFYKLKLRRYPINLQKRKIMNLFESLKWLLHKMLSKIKNF